MTFERVSAERLLKLYGSTRALGNVDLEFASGEITVIEGPNGSGKSTLLSLLGLLARPTSGRIRFDNTDAARRGVALRQHIGILSHETMLYPDLSGRNNLRFFARLFSQPDADQRIQHLTDRFSLDAFLDRPTRSYSRGQVQRVALARALLHRPKLLLLDEPSTGLDLTATEVLWNAVQEERDEGSIVVLVTHDPRCADTLAARRVVLTKGRVREISSGSVGAF